MEKQFFPPYAGLEFQGGICAQDLEIPSKRIKSAGDSPPEEFLIFQEIFAFMKWNSEKFANFCAMLDNFLVFVVIFYPWLRVIVFQFYKELNAVQSDNSKLSCKISHILPVFSAVIVYLHKMIINLKIINCKKSLFDC